MRIGYRAIVLLLFFVSGACGLVYEVTWMRLFRLAMGNTVYTSATVLTVFMAGLALGSYLAGRLADRWPRPLRLYGLLEAAVGLYGLLTPVLYRLAEPAYGWLYRTLSGPPLTLALGRFALSGLLLLIPCVLMGATLPLLSRFMAQHPDRLGRDVGRLYALNTMGAALGVVLAGFVLVPGIGVQRSIWMSAVANLAIGAVALWLARVSEPGRAGAPEEARSPAGGAPLRPGLRAAVLAGVAGAGFASMIYEVAWTRTLSLMIGSSVYAFALMLVAFIAGLGTGSMVLSLWIDRRRHLLAFLGGLELVVALAALVVAPLFGRLPMLVVDVVTRYAASFATLHLVEFGSIFLLMLVPTFCMGGVFPAVARLYTRELAQVGRSVGEAYAANTLGSVVGSFAAGFLLIPWLGAQHSLLVATAVNLGIGAYFVLRSGWGAAWRRAAVVGAAAALAVAGAWRSPPWDTVLLNSAPYLYAYRYKGGEVGRDRDLATVMKQNRRLLYAREGVTATVTVVESGGELYLKVNGKTDASSRGDLRSQSLLAHLPLLLHPDPRRVLVVGLGSGITAGAAERHPVDSIECVEISPEVVEAARLFAPVNYDALADPRLRLVVGDGRNHVALSTGRYDAILSQPSNLWIAGMADLFTREFFAACRERLAPGGLACCWIQAYAIRQRDVQSILATFLAVFPHVSLWESLPGGDYFLIGSEQPPELSATALRDRVVARNLPPELRRIGALSADNLVCSYVMEDEALRAYAGQAPINTDDSAVLEFSAPRGLYQGLVGQEGIFEVGQLAEYRRPSPDFLAEPADSGLQRIWQARAEARQALPFLLQRQYGMAWNQIELARRTSPDDMEVHRLVSEIGFRVGDELAGRQAWEESVRLYRRILEVAPDDGLAHYRIAKVLEQVEQPVPARQGYEQAVALAPRFVPAYLRLAALYARGQQPDRAEQVYRQALAQDPGNPDVIEELGQLLVDQQRSAEAIDLYLQAIGQEGDGARLCAALGVAYLQRREHQAAIPWLERAVRRDPSLARAWLNLGEARVTLGQTRRARAAFERVLAVEPDNRRALRAMRGLGH